MIGRRVFMRFLSLYPLTLKWIYFFIFINRIFFIFDLVWNSKDNSSSNLPFRIYISEILIYYLCRLCTDQMQIIPIDRSFRIWILSQLNLWIKSNLKKLKLIKTWINLHFFFVKTSLRKRAHIIVRNIHWINQCNW